MAELESGLTRDNLNAEDTSDRDVDHLDLDQPEIDHLEWDVEDEKAEGDRTTLVIGVIMALIALGIVGVLIVTGNGEAGDGGGQTPGESEVQPTTAVFGTLDEFDRANSGSLGAFTLNRQWEPFAGRWGIRNGDAAVIESDEFRNHVVIGLGQSDGAVQVRLDRLTAGAGIIFRFRGPYNYWAVVAAPNGNTWDLLRVQDSDAEIVGNAGMAPVADGTTVAARFTGEQIEVLVNGVVRLSVSDDFLMDEGRVGMTVRGDDATEARFDDFVAALPGNRPLFIGDGPSSPPDPTTTTNGG